MVISVVKGMILNFKNFYRLGLETLHLIFKLWWFATIGKDEDKIKNSPTFCVNIHFCILKKSFMGELALFD